MISVSYCVVDCLSNPKLSEALLSSQFLSLRLLAGGSCHCAVSRQNCIAFAAGYVFWPGYTSMKLILSFKFGSRLINDHLKHQFIRYALQWAGSD